jgi:hypothetical protein
MLKIIQLRSSFSLFRITTLILVMLAATVASGFADNVVDCSPTDDATIADCSPATTSFPIEQNVQQSVSGRALALTVSADGQRLYAGTFSGVWRSDDGGNTWHQLVSSQSPVSRHSPGHKGKHFISNALQVPNVYDLAVSPVDANMVLAGTAFDTRVRPKDGIYRSHNGGESWSLVHQFICPGASASGGGPVGQIMFAPDNANLVYAAGGCAIAISQDAGQTWIDSPIPAQGKGWHIAVAPEEGSAGNVIRRIYAAGDDQVWYSTNAGNTWSKDESPIIAQMGVFAGDGTKFGTVGGFPDASGFSDRAGNSSQVLAVEPGHSDHLYIVVANISNGPGYFFPGFPDGENCEQRVHCGGAAVWLGDVSQFGSQGDSGTWRRLASPPAYFGASTLSGRVYIVTKKIMNDYLVFLSDGAHVHVSAGRPEDSAAWHRLDGKDPSQSKRDNELANNLFLHVDPHAIAISTDFEIRLKRSDLPPPYNQNSELVDCNRQCGSATTELTLFNRAFF